MGGSSLSGAGADAIAAADPFGPQRKKYQNMLSQLLRDPGNFLKNPLYQAAFGQGQQALMRGMGKQGMIGSGNMAIGLQQFGQSFAWGAMQEQERFLAHLAGADVTPNAGPGLGAMAAGQSQMGGGLASLGSGIGALGKFFGM
jgi:hypothetical protein